MRKLQTTPYVVYISWNNARDILHIVFPGYLICVILLIRRYKTACKKYIGIWFLELMLTDNITV